MKLNLPDVTSINSVSAINSNFAAIEQELQNKVLYRDNPTGEPNTLATSVDANGKDIYNASTMRTQTLYIDGEQVVPSGVVVVTGGGVVDYSLTLQKANNLSDLASVPLAKANLGINNVDNTADIDKPVSTYMGSALAGKQATLVSGSNIKTINGNSILGSGDLSIIGGAGASSIQLSQTSTGVLAPVPDLTDGFPRYSLNKIVNTADDAQVWTGSQGKMTDLLIEHVCNGGAATGGRDVVQIGALLNAPTATIAGQDKNFVALVCTTKSVANDPTSGIFAFNPNVVLGGTGNAMNISAMEVNISARPGSAVQYKSGIQIACLPDDSTPGSLYDGMICLSNQSSPGANWRHGILIGNMNGQHPINATYGIIMGTVNTAACLSGIDFTSYTFSAAALNVQKGSAAIRYATATGTGSIVALDVDGSDNLVLGRGLAANHFYVNVDGAVKQVTKGAADSGGVGYSLLRVAN